MGAKSGQHGVCGRDHSSIYEKSLHILQFVVEPVQSMDIIFTIDCSFLLPRATKKTVGMTLIADGPIFVFFGANSDK